MNGEPITGEKPLGEQDASEEENEVGSTNGLDPPAGSRLEGKTFERFEWNVLFKTSFFPPLI